MDKDFFQNIPMTQTERITMASRPKQPKYARNKNILVIGGSGSGKTRFFCKPSLLQAHSSYVCTDPKGYNNIGQRKSHTVRRKSPAMWLFLYPI
jgi:type IV secretion system protein VirD4